MTVEQRLGRSHDRTVRSTDAIFYRGARPLEIIAMNQLRLQHMAVGKGRCRDLRHAATALAGRQLVRIIGAFVGLARSAVSSVLAWSDHLRVRVRKHPRVAPTVDV